MAGTVKASVLQHDVTGVAPVIRDGAGNEIGRFNKTFVNFAGSSGATVRGSFNISSMTYSSTALYTLSMTNAVADSYYAAAGTSTYDGTTSYWGRYISGPQGTMTSSQFQFGSVYAYNSPQDGSIITVMIVR